MACLDLVCTRPDCDWTDIRNEVVRSCPKCGERVAVFFDEVPEREERDEPDEERSFGSEHAD